MEHEIRKHMHNVISEMKNREAPIWQRAAKIIGEMLIIIFAVSFAVFMERQREHKHELAEAREFLLGLRTDLQNDVVEMESDKEAYRAQSRGLAYFANNSMPAPDSIKRYEAAVWSTTHLLVNKGRYEGFKSSGKMNTIENSELRNNILDFYEENLIGLTGNTRAYVDLKIDFQKMVYAGLAMKNGRVDLSGAFNPLVRKYCMVLSNVNEIVRRYDKAIGKSKLIINLISREYGEENK